MGWKQGGIKVGQKAKEEPARIQVATESKTQSRASTVHSFQCHVTSFCFLQLSILSQFCSEIILQYSLNYGFNGHRTFSHISCFSLMEVHCVLVIEFIAAAAKPSKIGGGKRGDLENIVQASHNFMNHY